MKIVVIALAGAVLAASYATPRQQGLVKAESDSTSLGQKTDMTEGQSALAPHSRAAPRILNYPCMDYNPAKKTCGLQQNREPRWMFNNTPKRLTRRTQLFRMQDGIKASQTQQDFGMIRFALDVEASGRLGSRTGLDPRSKTLFW